MQKGSIEPEIFGIFQHKVERIPHFARVTEVRHMQVTIFQPERSTEMFCLSLLRIRLSLIV